jgi:hypothetical protein
MDSKKLTSEEARGVEARIARVAGVIACRIRIEASGAVRDVHVETARDSDAAEITREVESVLRRDLDLTLEPSQIRVSSSGDAPATDVEEFPILEFASRFAFVSVNVVSSRDGVRAEVELTRETLSAFGAASSQNIAAPGWSVIAEATLRAVSEFLDDATRLCLIGVVKAPLGDDDAMVVRVDIVSSRCTKSLTGCALVGGNENQSVVFATLDAVNRVAGKLDFKTSIEYKIQ